MTSRMALRWLVAVAQLSSCEPQGIETAWLFLGLPKSSCTFSTRSQLSVGFSKVNSSAAKLRLDRPTISPLLTRSLAALAAAAEK
ncbi:MAG TPA: hypothetical protein VJ860_01720 [Polyangia bacterium]|nr:hypothetical protein [Polyangia bacterium]